MSAHRHLYLLRLYATASTALVVVLLLAAFQAQSSATSFEEINVQRINVVEADGRVRMVIANKQRSPAVVIAGRALGKPGERPGLIFYNDEGEENGGLIFGGSRVNGQTAAYGHLSFDRYGQDQVVTVTYREGGGKHSQGLSVLDRPPQNFFEINARRDSIRAMPDGPAKDAAWEVWRLWQGGAAFGAPRMFVGRDERKAAVVDLKDQHGRSRLRLIVDSLGDPRIEFLNDSGRVVRKFAELP